MSTAFSGYNIRPVSNLRDAMELRKVRNICREYMTHNQDEISVLRQLFWYTWTYKNRNAQGKLFAYLLELPRETLTSHGLVKDAVTIGFGILAKRSIEFDGREVWAVTGGLEPNVRGVGFGKAIFRFLSSIPKEDVYLDVLETNEPAIALYKSIGYKEISHPNGIIIMRLTR